jgi:putative hydrolase of the HAD superfamily
MIETATIVSNKTVSLDVIDKIIAIGHDLLQKPIELLPGVLDTLEQLKESHQLIVATKGDLLDQERKLKKSGLEGYFHHIEIMSDKKVADYQKLLKQLGCQPENFLMLGNSIKSDILPVLDLGAYGAHIPYSVTWTHEQLPHDLKSDNFIQLQQIDEVLSFLT